MSSRRIRRDRVCVFDESRMACLSLFKFLRFLSKDTPWKFLTWLTYITGGSLGWKTRGDLDPAFEKVAFELEPSTTAKPKYQEVKTGFGYHIIMVEGRK